MTSDNETKVENDVLGFINWLASNQKDLDPEIVEMVNKHFWELLA